MKKILITGLNSYIGLSLGNWLLQDSTKYSVEFISMRNDHWKTKDFSSFDAIFHVAGIAHVSTNPNMEQQYYKVNRDLTIEVARKAKTDNVKQFIFMSSIIVYGDSSNSMRVIDKNTVPNPSNFYGRSKLEAEKAIKALEGDKFKIAIVRPPMIYGKGSKGNYAKLAKVAKLSPIFPEVDNKRSMLHIDNLCQFIKFVIDDEGCGIYFPQNKEYVKTSDMVKQIAEAHGNKLRLLKGFNFVLNNLATRVEVINKMFGSLVYEKTMSNYRVDYRIRNFKNSIDITEK